MSSQGPEGAGRARKPCLAQRRGRGGGGGRVVPGRRERRRDPPGRGSRELRAAGAPRAASISPPVSCAPVLRSGPPGPAEPPPTPPRAPPPRRFGLLASGGRTGGALRAEAAAALGPEEADEGAERPRPGRRGEMASYVDNSFRQAVMKNPAERTSQVRPVGTWPDNPHLNPPPSPFLIQFAPSSPLLPLGPPTSNGIPSPSLSPWPSWVYVFRSWTFAFSLPFPLLTFLLCLLSRGVNTLISNSSPWPHLEPPESPGAVVPPLGQLLLRSWLQAPFLPKHVAPSTFRVR